MILSSLIHRNKYEQVATVAVTTPAILETQKVGTVAKVATVTVANPPESKNAALSVVCYTSIGNPMTIQARDAEHADFLRKMKPEPAQSLALDLPDSDDRRHCAECGNLASSGRCLAVWRGEIEVGSHSRNAGPLWQINKHCSIMAKRTQETFIKGKTNHRRTEGDYMSVLLDTVTLDDWRDVVGGRCN
jgi:hypothetical protein